MIQHNLQTRYSYPNADLRVRVTIIFSKGHFIFGEAFDLIEQVYGKDDDGV